MSSTREGWARVAAEAAGVTLVAVVIAVVANAVSPRGLSWTRDYFPALPDTAVTPAKVTAVAVTGADAGSEVPGAGPTNGVVSVGSAAPAVPAADAVVARLAQRGLKAAQFDEVLALFQDPRRDEERVLFVDARKDERFLEGHIPGAYPLDHYYPDRYLPELLPACQLAEVIVVYCTGGACEDSEFAALILKEAGVAAERLRVFPGGIDEWRARGQKVEVGARQSGDLKEAR